MTEENYLICVTCPRGCKLELEMQGSTVTRVKQGCKRGHEYARNEIRDPRRMVATTVKITGANHPLLPVCTSEPFPKGQIMLLADALRKITVQSPVNNGQVILENALDSGIDIIASRSM